MATQTPTTAAAASAGPVGYSLEEYQRLERERKQQQQQQQNLDDPMSVSLVNQELVVPPERENVDRFRRDVPQQG